MASPSSSSIEIAPSIEIAHLSFSYPQYGRRQHTHIFSDASLSVESGDIHVMLGLPGSGKSSLARVLIRAVPRYSGGEFSGSIKIDGVDISIKMPYEIMDILGYAAQDPDEQIIMTTVEDEIAFPLESLGLEREEIGRRVAKVMEQFALQPMAQASPAELSGGEKKRLLLAVNEAIGPEVIVLDEALEELDEQFRRQLIAGYKDQGRTVLVLASKVDEELIRQADSFSYLSGGKIREGSAEEVLGWYREYQQIESVDFSKERKTYLELNDVSFSYGKRFSLQIDRLSIDTASVTALVGPNGSGKTTLCSILCGLLPLDSGEIQISADDVSFGGRSETKSPFDAARKPAAARKSGAARKPDVKGTSADVLRRSVGYLFQNPDYQIFSSTVDEELGYGLKRAGIRGQDYDDALALAKDRFDLKDGTLPPTLLSYGERKRLQAASYYLLPRGLYIFDEIDSGLSFREICSMLQIFADTGAGIVLVTHHLSFAQRIAQTVITMENGRAASVQRGQG